MYCLDIWYIIQATAVVGGGTAEAAAGVESVTVARGAVAAGASPLTSGAAA